MTYFRSVPSMTRDEFWANVEECPTGCWEWTGRRNRDSYGQARYGGVTQGAHRIAWIIANDDAQIPSGGFICHHCDNPPCVNPAHLYLGDAGTNARDARARITFKPRRRRTVLAQTTPSP